MSVSTDAIIGQLRKLQLSAEAAMVYLELLRSPSTYLQISHATGINRTTVYRIAAQLEKRKLIAVENNTRGTFLVASDPIVLEGALIAQEEALKEQRRAFSSLMPNLMAIKEGDVRGFIVRTYQGTEGFRQMLAHELGTQGEMLIFGSGTLSDLVEDDSWTENHRKKSLERNHTARLLLNPGSNIKVYTFDADSIVGRFAYRVLPTGTMYLQNQVAVYNDTTAIYHWREEDKTGVEIINKNYAMLMRQIFDHYWDLAERYGATKTGPVLKAVP